MLDGRVIVNASCHKVKCCNHKDDMFYEMVDIDCMLIKLKLPNIALCIYVLLKYLIN